MWFRPSESARVHRRVVVDAQEEHHRPINELVEICKRQKEDILKKRRPHFFNGD